MTLYAAAGQQISSGSSRSGRLHRATVPYESTAIKRCTALSSKESLCIDTLSAAIYHQMTHLARLVR